LRKSIGSKKLLSIFVSQPHFESAIQLRNTASIGISDNPRAPSRMNDTMRENFSA